jgi:hypothetical protein
MSRRRGGVPLGEFGWLELAGSVALGVSFVATRCGETADGEAVGPPLGPRPIRLGLFAPPGTPSVLSPRNGDLV